MTRILAVSFTALALAASLGSPIARADNDTKITGQVYDYETGHPLADAEIVVQAPQADRVARTDEKGFFIIYGLPVANYYLLVRHTGYCSVAQNVAPVPFELPYMVFSLRTMPRCGSTFRTLPGSGR